MVVREKRILINCVSFGSVNCEKCRHLLEVVIAFLHVSVFYSSIVSTFVIEIKSYLSEQNKNLANIHLLALLYLHAQLQQCKKWGQIFMKFEALSVIKICVCVKILVNVKAYMYCMCTPCT